MANRLFGEAELKRGDGSVLTLRFDFNALLEAEDAADMGTEDMLAAVNTGKPRLKVARALLWGALQHHHPEITLDGAGDLLSEDTEAVSAAMGKAMQEMAARKQAGQNPPKGAGPRKTAPSRGTGTSSSKSGAKQG